MIVLLPKYVFRQLARALAPALLIYTFVLMPFYVGQMLRHGVGVVTVLGTAPLVFPFISGYVMPPTILTGASLAYGRLGNDNEFASSQASGVWPGWMLMPAVATGFLATLLTLYLNENVLTSAAEMVTDRLLENQLEMVRTRLSRRGGLQVGPRHLFRHPEDAQGRMALDVTEYAVPTDAARDAARAAGDVSAAHPRVAKRIIALDHDVRVEKRFDPFVNENRHVVVLVLRNAMVEQFRDGATQPLDMDRGEQLIFLEEGKRFSLIADTRVACWGISKLRRRLRETRTELADPGLDAGREKDLRERVRKYEGELHSRLALSFSCLLFGVVGPLLGLVGRHADRAARFGAAFGLVALYFVLFILMRSLTEYATWATWIPNILLALYAIRLWRKSFWAA